MTLVRRWLVRILSIVLLISLVGGAVATSTDLALAHPNKLETWLNQTNLYSHFVSSVIDQSQKTTGGNAGSSSVSLSDAAVQQAANTAFPPAQLQQYVSTFMTSNYTWLEGKTSVPIFSIDLTSAKQNFATQVGHYVQTYLGGLPACSSAQLATLSNTQNLDPLSLSCRPASIDPQTEATTVTQQLSTDSSFLSNPILTASSINPNKSSGGQPYYQKLSALPRLYRLSTKLPWILGAVALVSMIGIVFTAPRGKRRGARRIAEVLLTAGVILAAIKFVADAVFKSIQNKLFDSASVGQLQQALTSFLNHLENQLVKVDLWFGVGFLVAAAIISIFLFITRQQGGLRTPAVAALPVIDPDQPTSLPLAAKRFRFGRRQSTGCSTSPVQTSPKPETLSAKQPSSPSSTQPKAKKRRLIQ